MNHKRWLPQMIGLTLVALLLAACGPLQPAPTPTPTPIPPTPTPTPVPVSISGQAKSFDDPPQSAPDRRIVLCLVEEVLQEKDAAHVKASCALNANLTAVTDSKGRFEFQDVPDGSYMLLYDDTIEDFEAGLVEWDGKVVKIGYSGSQRKELSSYEEVFTMVLNEMLPSSNLLLPTFTAAYVNPPDRPFLVAATIDKEAVAFTPVVVEVKAGETAKVDIEVFGSKQK